MFSISNELHHKKKKKALEPVRLITVSFLVIIVVGTLLLLLPISQKNNNVNFTDALFVATSATCITGLTPFDTFSTWTPFGQGIILVLIQLGGLGLMSFTTFFTILLRGKLGFRSMKIAKESTNAQIVDIPSLVRVILVATFIFEGVGAILLSFRFVPMFGNNGIWISIFLSISAYCNAGFDILGFITPGSSLMEFSSDGYVLIVISLLIIFGGLGFMVVSEIYTKLIERLDKRNVTVKKFTLSFHSNVVLIANGILLVLGTVLYMISEKNGLCKDVSFGNSLLNAFFQSTASRTAGFNSFSIAGETSVMKCVTIALMFIGASPGSTGGGVKTTTFMVLLATVISVCKGNDEALLFKRKISKDIIYRSMAIVAIGVTVCLFTTALLLFFEQGNNAVSPLSALFESVSAFGTVGLSADVTSTLSFISKYAIIATMFIGRIGPVSMALVFNLRNTKRNIIYPNGKINVG